MSAARQAALPSSPASAFVDFVDVEKSYDGRAFAVTRLNLGVARGEFLTLLGPSGSGKTTTLNMLAGFERPTSGTITLEGRPVDRLPPYQRNIGMVFQNYALFPHMSVEENVAFPLSVRQVSKADIAGRVGRALDMVRLKQFGDRKPAQLSGGQQQRVALARALVFEPSLVLMDEPLGALDKKLREHMQLEIKRIHTMLGVTIVYVTHDQSEALTMSDRVAVFNNGAIAQLGSPDDLYNAPQSSFVASFIGENNTLEGVVDRVSGKECRVRLTGGGELTALAIGVAQGAACHVAIRPERLSLMPTGANALPATVDGRIYLGDHLRLLARLGNDQVLTVKVGPEATMANGEAVTVSCAPQDCRAFPTDAGTGAARIGPS
ncbi:MULTISPECIES: ABC transporter ATP-binding protein [unclassified Mesorhizobium]|uniref:ABC transporter ATP-binding protein n=1 Tax=unclassified Mesorhizobium TaxID=325217 RepID=UPI000BAE7FD3|nr:MULTISPECIES: ABC transporter ATP-binding protein [unclassified Mesorhizobium]PBB23353.1 Fe3+/spermidine/putrescine ABC transporter ATP-binding protein [Mesorhizobium sp. WSM4304]PBB72197.1 Fe3+/spermidine/putrescine ABC transporter ATP-binding protein [Mesorhizobium sp. WSM4308]